MGRVVSGGVIGLSCVVGNGVSVVGRESGVVMGRLMTTTDGLGCLVGYVGVVVGVCTTGGGLWDDTSTGLKVVTWEAGVTGPGGGWGCEVVKSEVVGGG